LTKRKLYRIIYSNAFHKELSSIVNYILYALHNRNAARRLYKSVIGSIESRSTGFPDAYEIFRDDRLTKEYYRIYVNNYVVYYSLKEDVMVVEHIFYSKQNVLELLS